MSVDPELLEILVCPETQQAVKPAEADVLARLNEQIRAGSVRNRGGETLSQPIQEGLLRADGKVLYPVEDGIPVMLVDESIEL